MKKTSKLKALDVNANEPMLQWRMGKGDEGKELSVSAPSLAFWATVLYSDALSQITIALSSNPIKSAI